MKKFRKLIGFIVVFITVMAAFCTVSFAATVGQSLPTPEDGWKRYEEASSQFVYSSGWSTQTNACYSSGAAKFSSIANSTVTFKFYGTQFRIISFKNTDRSGQIDVTIDGGTPIRYMHNGTPQSTSLLFESQVLTNTLHTVEVKNIGGYWEWDALDILGDGYLCGQPLTSPEAGWQRIDDSDRRLIYNGSGWYTGSVEGLYNGYQHATNQAGDNITFKFSGSKLRVIASTFINNPNNVRIKIDDIEYTFNEYSPNTQVLYPQVLLFEKTNLPNKVHTVVITNPSSSYYSGLDAIDIDDTGKLLYFYEPINLSAISDGSKINLSWSPSSTDNVIFNIKRSTTSGQEITIATTSAISFIDKNVEYGVIYFYVVSAVDSLNYESANSNEVSTVPVASKAILEITMTNGQIKEYDLTATELDKFLTWYDNRANGTDKSYFTINKRSNVKPFLSRKEYIQFDKIYSFEVKDYNE